MDGLGVTQLADSAGVASSTVRFYERVGLISPARRAPNGYRVFDEAAIEELEFISRAKGIGMSLEDIAELVAVWPNGECRSLQARLRTFLVERTGQVRVQIAELGAFERQLQTVLGRLAVRDPGPERCGTNCGCESDLDIAEAPDPRGQGWGCSLRGDGLSTRIGQWEAVAAAAERIERTADAVHLEFRSDPGVIASLAALCAAETVCCTQTRFVLEVTAGRVTVTAEAPGAPGLLDALFPVAPGRR